MKKILVILAIGVTAIYGEATTYAETGTIHWCQSKSPGISVILK